MALIAIIALLAIGLGLSAFIGGFISGTMMHATGGKRTLSDFTGIGVTFSLALTVVYSLSVLFS